MRYDNLASSFLRLGCKVEMNAPMSRITSFRIGGPADLLVTASNYNDVISVKQICESQSIPLTYMGNGSNMLVSDKGVDGIVLRMDSKTGEPAIENDLVVCSAGVSLKKLCTFSKDAGLSGLEFAYGIPGSVGGAVYMNAGAYGGQFSDVVQWVDALFPDGQIRRVDTQGLKFGYRHSVFMENGAIVMAAAFRLTCDSPSSIAERMDEFMRRRRDKQPLEYPSAGSFFKRPEGFYAGALIEGSGLKGFSVGAAQVSDKHAGFIINRGGATCDEVIRLAEIVTKRVLLDSGITLEPEVRFVGRN
ncbi:MAG: UDP-N-acetylmuramate dehydrogenase [Oscillospiraceae bacterium]|nr:UDP-N-acetylmuramate dehydrogenase [Oscillospiraceae bacterium]